jgi:tRNA threonylcarbamoyladenosine biosynthesis protein TsaE
MQVISHSVRETIGLGKRLAKYSKAGDIICLSGQLGTGKTVLTKGIAAGLGIDKDKVTSSSFILIRRHLEGRLPLYHFDLYRLQEITDISALGYEEYLYSDGLTVIEWSERLDCLAPKEYLMVKLYYGGQSARRIEIKAVGLRYKELLEKI